MMRCPCRKKSETTIYAACCQPLHNGASAATPEALMRSRYAAFALHKEPYLLTTWHASTRPKQVNFAPGETWIQLKVLSSTVDVDTATVAFEARYRNGGATGLLSETSRFVREGGRWFYVDGVVHPPA
jgi:SEC-C motif domain protein